MESSKLVKFLADITPKERERFRQFVISPYINQHEKTTELMKIILDAIDRGTEKSLDKCKVFKKLFPGVKYDEQQLHNIMSYLKKLYHKFLAYEMFEQSDFQEELFALEAAFESNQFDLLKNRGKQLEKTLERHPHRDYKLFYANYKLNSLLAYYAGHYEDRSKSENFQQMLDNLDRFYLAEKLRHCCHLTANMMMMNTHYNFRLLDDILEHIRENWDEFQEVNAVIVYYTILMSLREDNNPEHYQTLKVILDTKIDSLSHTEQADLYTFLTNHCIRQINLGANDYHRELFQLYKLGLRTGLLLDHGLLSEWNFKNITVLGCSLKEYEWTEQFINDYKDKLPAKHRDNAFNYNLAHLYFNKKMYNEALDALLLVQFTDVKYHLNTTFLLLRTYYELRDTEALLSLIETFRIYVIRSQKISTDQKRGYTNFLRFAKRLVMLKHQSYTYSKQNLKDKLSDLHQKIDQTKNVINKFWLLEECAAA
ncbi:MAG: hypothetical protein H6562_14890 [Lewinellaceae bacterium]|nr:hypothetical protein [Lewinella sp.]MCB9280176.1 hypothetical protein [Lewinellaceae bacterium]